MTSIMPVPEKLRITVLPAGGFSLCFLFAIQIPMLMLMPMPISMPYAGFILITVANKIPGPSYVFGEF